tara:strand:- start:4706 stop:5002 length:297 start_codon:yes stop_codon:yes gene_type:complete
VRWVRAFLCVSAARSNAEAREDDVMHDRFDEIAKSRPSLPNSRDDFGRVQGFFLGIFDEFFFLEIAKRRARRTARVEPSVAPTTCAQPWTQTLPTNTH